MELDSPEQSQRLLDSDYSVFVSFSDSGDNSALWGFYGSSAGVPVTEKRPST